MVLDGPARHGELVERVGHGVDRAVAQVVVLGLHGDGAGRRVVLGDHAHVGVEQRGHLLGDLAEKIGDLETA